MTISPFKLPFDEQIAYFKRKLNLPTDSYADIYGEEHDYAFVVAGANRNDILVDFREAVDKAIEQGTTLEAFRKDFDNIVAKYGWDYKGGRNWRSRTIYDTNLYSSYQAGRYQQHQEIKHLRPFWEYRHRDGQKNPRPLHQSWNGIVLHADHPWWRTHYPVNAYNCHCTVYAHSQRSLARRGLTITKNAPEIEYETKTIGTRSGRPRTVKVPIGIDPGFDRIPGRNRHNVPSQVLLDKAIAVPPDLASRVVRNVLAVAEVRKLLNAEVARMVDTVADEKVARGVMKSVGVLPAEVVEALASRDLAVATSVITLRDKDILHSIRDSKDDVLPLSFLRNIATHLAEPEAVLLDVEKKDNALIYVFSLPDSKGKVIVRLDYSLKKKNADGTKETIITNVISSGKVFEWTEQMRQGFKKYEVVYGEIK